MEPVGTNNFFLQNVSLKELVLAGALSDENFPNQGSLCHLDITSTRFTFYSNAVDYFKETS